MGLFGYLLLYTLLMTNRILCQADVALSTPILRMYLRKYTYFSEDPQGFTRRNVGSSDTEYFMSVGV